MSDVAMKVWMRNRSAALSASAQASMSPATARERPQGTARLRTEAMLRTLSKSPRGGYGKARLDHVDPELLEGASAICIFSRAERL